jgi:hypothetical protein
MKSISRFLRLARAVPPDHAVPYAFEKRIMARIRAGVEPMDAWSFWAPAMWRAAFGCLAVMLITSAVVRYAHFDTGSELFAGDLERTVLAPVDVDDSW